MGNQCLTICPDDQLINLDRNQCQCPQDELFSVSENKCVTECPEGEVISWDGKQCMEDGKYLGFYWYTKNTQLVY